MSTCAPTRPAAPEPSSAPAVPDSPPVTDRERFTADDRVTLTRLLRRLHFYAGILVGPFLLIAAVTGFLYALAPSAESLLHRDLLNASSTAQTTPLSAQVSAARKSEPTLRVGGAVVGAPGRNTMVLFTDDTLGESRQRAVFVDPGTGQVEGSTVVYGSSYALPERTWLSEMHRRLHLGEPGRIYSELAASWLAPIALVGISLWWRQRRTVGRARELSARGAARRTHTTVGLVMAIGFLFLSATGLTWSKHTGANIGDLRTQMHWKTPSVSTALPGAAAGTAAGMAGEHTEHQTVAGAATLDVASFDRVTATAQRELQAPYLVTPGKQAKAWTAKETRHSWTVGPDAIAVAPTTGEVTARVDFASYPLAAKLTDWGIRLHMGFMFGLANQFVLAAIAASLAVVTVHGYRMWWLRRPTRRDSVSGSTVATARVGRPPRRGAMRRLFRAHPVGCTLAAVAVAVIGWCVPLLGISLTLFLIIDSAIESAARENDEGSCCS